MEHRPEEYRLCIVDATARREHGRRGRLDQRARVASAVRAASFKRRSVYLPVDGLSSRCRLRLDDGLLAESFCYRQPGLGTINALPSRNRAQGSLIGRIARVNFMLNAKPPARFPLA
jgi:hypothetical protein